MAAVQVLQKYFLWHYTKGFADLWHFFGNLLWAISNIFSIFFLLRSLFAPFERMHEDYRASADAEDLFENILTNIILRIVGALLRLAVIAVGLACMALTLTLECAALVAWPLLPALAVCLFLFGVGALS